MLKHSYFFFFLKIDTMLNTPSAKNISAKIAEYCTPLFKADDESKKHTTAAMTFVHKSVPLELLRTFTSTPPGALCPLT